MEQLCFVGEFEFVHRDVDGRILYEGEIDNAPTLAGLNDVLAAAFANGTQRTAWYIGLIDNTNFDELDYGDSMASHPGWSELLSYSGGGRRQWTPLTVGGALVANSVLAEFVFSATVNVKGIFVSSSPSLGGTTGILWSTAQFLAVRSFTAGQSLQLLYRVRASGGNG